MSFDIGTEWEHAWAEDRGGEADQKDEQPHARAQAGGGDQDQEEPRGAYLNLLDASVVDLHEFVAKRVKNRTDAADLAQQTLLLAYAKLSTLRTSNLRGWLFAIARNQIIDHFRARSRFEFEDVTEEMVMENEAALQTPPDAVQVLCACREEVGDWMRCITRRLRVEEQVAVLLADVHSFRDKESATLLSMSLPSFKLLLHAARRSVREYAPDAGHCPRPVGVRCPLSRRALLALRNRLLESIRGLYAAGVALLHAANADGWPGLLFLN